MGTLTAPNFSLPAPNPSAMYPNPVWWLWLRMKDHVGADLALGGIYAKKSGFHNTGNANAAGNYSIRDKINQSGPGMTKASALDLTFRSAQSGDYRNIDKYTSRLVKSALDSSDPRLDMILFEFYGQADSDTQVEGYNEFREANVSSDKSHLWHIHLSFIRSKVGDWWGMWALYTVLIGWSVAQWRDSLPKDAPKPAPKPTTPSKLPSHAPGSRENSASRNNIGTDVQILQTFIGSAHCGPADGRWGAKTTAGVKWYQRMRGLDDDGIAGPKTWGPIKKALG